MIEPVGADVTVSAVVRDTVLPLPTTLARRFRPLSGGGRRAGSFKTVNDLRVGADVNGVGGDCCQRSTRLAACDDTTPTSAVAGCRGVRTITTVHRVHRQNVRLDARST